MEVTQDMRQQAIDYKKNIAGKFMLVEGAKIKARISGEQFCVPLRGVVQENEEDHFDQAGASLPLLNSYA